MEVLAAINAREDELTKGKKNKEAQAKRGGGRAGGARARGGRRSPRLQPRYR